MFRGALVLHYYLRPPDSDLCLNSSAENNSTGTRRLNLQETQDGSKEVQRVVTRCAARFRHSVFSWVYSCTSTHSR